MQQKKWENHRMAKKVLLFCISPKVGQLSDAYMRFNLALERYHEDWFNFVRWLVSLTNNTRLLPFKLSKINSHILIISLGFPIKSKTPLDHWNDHFDSHFIILINVPSLSGCFLSKLENHPDHLVRLISSENGRKDYSSPQLPIICLSSSFPIKIPF